MLYDITNLKRNTLISSPVNTATESIGIPLSDSNISQSNNNVKSDTLPKYSMQESINNTQELDNSSFSYDSEGRKLSKQQQDYFKDSVVRDENGNLKEVYHGSPNEKDLIPTGRIDKNGYKVYKADEHDCSNCPFKEQCTKSKYK